ncbi:MAG: metallopeptidase [Thermoproteus sp.]|nr:metallopeptidase [Thermoproteus sp.]
MARLKRYEEAVKLIAARSGLPHLSSVDIYVVSTDARSRAYARIWGIPRPLQEALGLEPGYVVELLPTFWTLDCRGQVKVLAHEIAHIPRTASGAVRPHNRAFWADFKVIYKNADGVCGIIEGEGGRGRTRAP